MGIDWSRGINAFLPFAPYILAGGLIWLYWDRIRGAFCKIPGDPFNACGDTGIEWTACKCDLTGDTTYHILPSEGDCRSWCNAQGWGNETLDSCIYPGCDSAFGYWWKGLWS